MRTEARIGGLWFFLSLEHDREQADRDAFLTSRQTVGWSFQKRRMAGKQTAIISRRFCE